jgi:L-ribulose-5-phosphate 3-epimerase
MPDFAMPVGLYEKALPADWTWAERLRAAGRAGYDFVEISIDESDGRLARLDWGQAERADLRRVIAECGVPIFSMCLSGHRKYPLGSHDPEVRQRALDILRKAIQFATDIGLRIIQLAGYDVFYEPSDTRSQACFIDGLHCATRWAGEAGVMLGLENVDVPIVESVGRLLRVVRDLNSPWLHLYPDMANLAAAGYNPADELKLAGGELVAVHVKDGRPGVIRGVRFETGIVPLPETFRTLASIGFWGPLTVEMWADMDGAADPVDSAAAARQLVGRLTRLAWAETDQDSRGKVANHRRTQMNPER